MGHAALGAKDTGYDTVFEGSPKVARLLRNGESEFKFVPVAAPSLKNGRGFDVVLTFIGNLLLYRKSKSTSTTSRKKPLYL